MISTDILLRALPQVDLHAWRFVQVRDVVCDSRRVALGDLFVAYAGVAVDGHRFVPDALRAGAVAFVVERMLPELEGVPTAIVPDAREAYARLHAALNGFPAHKLRVIGVTGTDGKTTTTRLIAAILRAAGKRVGQIDTVGAMIGDQELDTGFHTTTPDAPEVQQYLAQMVAAGIEYAVIESTSHGLAQQRLAGCEFDVAVVTNITHEHLDFHGTYEAYREAKALLFRALASSVHKPGMPKVAVMNADDSSYAYLCAIPAEVQIAYGLERPPTEPLGIAWATAHAIESSPAGLHFLAQLPHPGPLPRGEGGGTARCALPGGEGGDAAQPPLLGERVGVRGALGALLCVPIESPLVGRYNIYNILAALSVAGALGITPEAMRAGVAAMRGVPGRMERIHQGQPFTAIVDFAHTPNALENALRAVREMADGRVIVVFGCAGLRDRAKRPWMGEIAGRLADVTVITAEDPRTESLDAIMEEIAAGCRRAGRVEGEGFYRVGDRGRAIQRALELAQPGDVVVVTGKGHERSMCFGTTEYPWSDQEAVEEALRRLGYG